MASTALTAGVVAPMRQRQTMEFPYKHSTGETVGRFLAGLKEQKKIWGQRVSGQGVVVPPLGYSEVDASAGGAWVEVKNTGVITAAARVDRPIARLHLSATPFAFVLVRLDGADTALAHIVRDDLDRVAVGARVEVVWAADEARVGSIRDIDSFRVIADAPPQVKREAKAVATPIAKAPARKPAKVTAAAKPAKKKVTAARPAKSAKPVKPAKAAKTAKATKSARKARAAKPGKLKKRPTVVKKARKVVRAKAVKPARAKARKPAKSVRAKKPRTVKKPAKSSRKKATKRPRRR